MAKKDKSIIRKGDRIRIDDPQVFVRCGYPMNKKDTARIIHKEYEEQIMEFVRQFSFLEWKKHDKLVFGDTACPIVEKIEELLAVEYMRKRNFGGNKRKIYTKQVDVLKGREYTVDAVRFVKTGKYVSASASCSYTDDYGEPAYLDEARTHKLLRIYAGWVLGSVWIEACRCTQVKSILDNKNKNVPYAY